MHFDCAKKKVQLFFETLTETIALENFAFIFYI